MLREYVVDDCLLLAVQGWAESVEIGKELPGKSYMLAGN